MARVLSRIPHVKPSPEGRPSACPFCHSPVLQQWGRVSRPLKDPQLAQVEAHRDRRTFRHYPQGVTRPAQSQRTAGFRPSGGPWASPCGRWPPSFPTWASVLRDVRALKEEVQRRLPITARVLGVDGWGRGRGC